MVRPPSIDSNGMKKGAWSEDEDNKLRAYILRYGHWNWRLLPKYAGLKRCGKSCRLRWVNYLKPGVKRGNFTKEEQELVIKLHAELGNRWSAIAEQLPGRTDNEIKNFWHTRVERRRKTNPTAVKKLAKAKTISEASSEASSLSTPQPLSNPSLSTNSQDQLDLEFMLSQMLAADTNCVQNEECFAPFLAEEFDYPELRYSELSCSGSSYANQWTVDAEVCGSFWKNVSSASNITSNSESETSSYTPLQEEGLQYYDPLLQYFDYEMNLF